MMRRFFSLFSLKTLIIVPTFFLIFIGAIVYYWLHLQYQQALYTKLQTQSANQAIRHLVPGIQERIYDNESLKLFLYQVIQNNPEIFYIGLSTQGKNYLHVSAPEAKFENEPFHIKHPLKLYPHIQIEAIINMDTESNLSKIVQPLPWYGFAMGFIIVILSISWTLFILKPIKRLIKNLETHTGVHKDSKPYKQSNELLEMAKYIRGLVSSNRIQKRRQERLNVHLEELVHAKTSSLKAEIEENTKAKKRLEVSNEEKTILLKEVHHRVKNNLAIIVGLIRMQSRRISDPNTKSMFMDLQNRIKTMELIHTNLYTTAQFNKIMMKEYLSLLVKHLSSSFTKDNESVMFSILCEDVSMDIDQAITCGQIINELVTNAFKHAFKGVDDGHIWIKLVEIGDHFELLVEDNGNGGDSELSPKHFSLGLSLVHELTRYQLKGTVNVSNEKGLKYTIVFRKKQF